MAEELNESEVREALRTVWLGRTYIYVPEISSTNERLKEWAGDSAYPSGTVLLADYQLSGRGRLDRRWEAPRATSLLCSILLRPHWPARQGPWLTMAGGLAVAEAIESTLGLGAGLKWPNDVVIEQDGEWHKVCGLLLEVVLVPDGRLTTAILGIGLNVNIDARDLPDATTPATSLLVATGRPVSRLSLLVTLLERLERHYDAALDGQSPVRAWREKLVTLGRQVVVTFSEAGGPRAAEGVQIAGIAEDVDEWGQLLVRDGAGVMHTIAAGDVTLRGR